MVRRRFFLHKSQSILEESLLIFILVVALLAMGGYVKRAFQGRYRSLADSVGEQYSPAHVKSDITTSFTTSKTTTVESYEKDDKIYSDTTVKLDNDTQSRSGSENLDAIAEESLFE